MVKIPNFLEATAHGVLNDILSQFRSDEGYAQPNKYEIVIIPPTKRGGGSQTNMFAGSERSSDLRKISLKLKTQSTDFLILSLSSRGWYHVA